MADTVSTPFQTRVEQAAKVMGIDVDSLWAHLFALGIENTADGESLLAADTTTESDARAIMVDGKGAYPAHVPNTEMVKIARFKAGWAVLKGRGQKPEALAEGDGIALKELVEAIKPVTQFKDKELLARYNLDAPSDVMEELKRRSHDRPFIVFSGETTSVMVEVSAELLSLARRHEVPSTYMVDNKLVRTHRVGEFPMLFVEECPLHSDHILADGFCEKCQDTWKGVEDIKRVAARVALNLGAVHADDLAEIQSTMQLAKNDRLINIPRVALELNELAADKKLPVLRRRMSRTGSSDPFYVKK